MSDMQTEDPVIAIACSDVHLSLRPPVARAEEPDWFEAMARPWKEIKALAQKHDAIVLCAGDIFDKWNSPAELINWGIENLPRGMWAIPGNHDLPSHRLEGLERTAYATLVKSGQIRDLDGGHGASVWFKGDEHRMDLFGQRFGRELEKPSKKSKRLKIAVVHEYIWINDHSYPGAPLGQRLNMHTKKFSQYDVVVIGDNHKGFIRKLDCGTIILNCGTLMRRKSDEADYKPWVGLIHASGKVDTHYLDTSQDVLTVLEPGEEQDEAVIAEIRDFLEELSRLEATRLDYREAMVRVMDRQKVNESIRAVIIEAME
jgi:DNA repair exonuclease SbcCD nuclease subunit